MSRSHYQYGSFDFTLPNPSGRIKLYARRLWTLFQSNYSHLEDQLFSNFFWLFEKKFQQKTVFIEWLTRPIKLKKVELVLKESMSTYRYKNCLDYLITMSLEL